MISIQDLEWAAYLQGSDGENLPAGPGCATCWKVGMDILMYDCFEAFMRDYKRDEALRARVDKIKANISNKSNVDFTPCACAP